MEPKKMPITTKRQTGTTHRPGDLLRSQPKYTDEKTQKLIQFLSSLVKKSMRINTMPEWIKSGIFNMVYTYILLKKYNATCKHLLGYRIYINETNETNETNQTNQTNEINTYQQKNIIKIGNCIMNGKKKIIAFPLKIIVNTPPSVVMHKTQDKIPINNHLNTLIFHRNNHTIEHFEPHGINYKRKNFVEPQLTVFIKELNKYLKENNYNKKIKLVKSEVVCPNLGPQSKAYDEGYCSAWSLLIYELSLKFPDFTTKYIIEVLLSLNNNLSLIILGYITLVNEEFEKNMERLGIKYEDLIKNNKYYMDMFQNSPDINVTPGEIIGSDELHSSEKKMMTLQQPEQKKSPIILIKKKNKNQGQPQIIIEDDLPTKKLSPQLKKSSSSSSSKKSSSKKSSSKKSSPNNNYQKTNKKRSISKSPPSNTNKRTKRDTSQNRTKKRSHTKM
jgi:hypothetical protein